jgi:hypothetical protein
VLAGPPGPLIALLTGRLPLARARDSGVRYDGDPALLARLQPGLGGAGSH